MTGKVDMAGDRHERKHRRTARHPECVAAMAGADFEAAFSMEAALGQRLCIHAQTFPCRQCKSNRRWNEAATGEKLTEREFERRYAAAPLTE
jgi:hypothetical protein